MTLSLNGLDVISARVTIPWRGVWSAEVELAPEEMLSAQMMASLALPAVLLVGEVPLTCTIDPKGSGTFVSRAVIRVVGGRGQWGTRVSPQHFTLPGGGLTSSVVRLATGLAAGGETVADPLPEVLGENYARVGGPASDAMGDNDWHVDPITGATLVAPWPPLPLDPEATLIDYAPTEKRATITTDKLLLPGTTIVDTDGRLNGQSLTIRDVEQRFTSEGALAHAWCSDAPSSRLLDAVTGIVRSVAGTRYLKTYRYVFALGVGAKLALQAKSADAPDLNPIDQWTGLSGALDILQPGTEIVVGFAEGKAQYPYLVAFSPFGIPLNVAVTASVGITLTAPAIAIAGASTFGVPGTAVPLTLGPWATAVAGVLADFAIALGGSTDPAVTAAATGLTSALSALPPSQTIIMKGN